MLILALRPSIQLLHCGFQVVYRPHRIPYSKNNKRTKTSGSFLCGLTEWVEGDYIDDAELNALGT